MSSGNERTILTAVLRRKGKNYTVMDDFGPGFREDWASACWVTGTMASPTSRSILIREQCDESFPILPPWDTSTSLVDWSVESGDFLPIPESPLVREHLLELRRELWPQEWTSRDNRDDHFAMDMDHGAKRPEETFQKRERLKGPGTGMLRYLARRFPKSKGVHHVTEADMLSTRSFAQ